MKSRMKTNRGREHHTHTHTHTYTHTHTHTHTQANTPVPINLPAASIVAAVCTISEGEVAVLRVQLCFALLWDCVFGGKECN